MTKVHTIDASGKVFGRVASSAAVFLMAKDSPEFVKNKVADVKVNIINASKTKMSERRMAETLHETYSGYPGGQKFATNQKIVEKKGWKGLYELAVSGMLPSNKLKPQMMKKLTITE